jgi:glycerol uptake facilitator-like aquaporin
VIKLTYRLYISLSFGFSLAVNAWIFFRVSGGLFNPAVSLGMVLVGALTPLRGVLLTFSQILGGITVSHGISFTMMFWAGLMGRAQRSFKR